MSTASGDRRLKIRVALESLEAARHGAWKAGRFARFCADDEPVEPWLDFFVEGHPVSSLEDDLLNSAVRRDLDGVPDG